MTGSQTLDLILSEVLDVKEVAGIKEDVAVLKSDVAILKQRVTGIEVHLENHTDKNIELIAENFIEFTNKLNQAIPVTKCQGLFNHYDIFLYMQSSTIIRFSLSYAVSVLVLLK